MEAGNAKLEEGKADYAAGEQKLAEAKQQLDAGNAAYAENEKKMAEAKANLDQGKADLAKGKAEYAAGQQKLADGKNQLDAGRAQLANGKAQLAEYETGLATYNSGLEEYEAGKAQLEDGAVQLAEGREKLEDAEKQLEEGEKQILEGEELIAQFEDGRDQIIAGIEQLKATPADGDLVSIADRLGDNYTYMKNETDLDIPQGYVAVAAGRSYVSDNGDAVTVELTGRILGIALCAAAAVLGLLAGLLGVFGKAKASGVLSVLTAVAAGVGLYYAMQTRLTFSEVAGTSGSLLAVMGCAVLATAAVINAVVALFVKAERSKVTAEEL